MKTFIMIIMPTITPMMMMAVMVIVIHAGGGGDVDVDEDNDDDGGGGGCGGDGGIASGCVDSGGGQVAALPLIWSCSSGVMTDSRCPPHMRQCCSAASQLCLLLK